MSYTTDFPSIHNRSSKLAAAVFMVSNLMDQSEELKTRVKNLSLRIISASVNLKDTDLSDSKKIITELEKSSLELMSMLDIASISGLISKMNGDILREEFQSFISELGKFYENLESRKNISVKNLFSESLAANVTGLKRIEASIDQKVIREDKSENHKEHNRKDSRKNAVLEFIKGHGTVNIKDIAPNINGCSEKTIQRELISLIKEGKIKRTGERRWSRYSIV